MRCPRCRHRPMPLSRLLLLGAGERAAIVCWSCGARLYHEPLSTVKEGIAVWLLMMIPLAPVALAPGLFTFLVTLALYVAIAKVSPWEGFRYRLALAEEEVLPEARLLPPRSTRGSSPTEPREIPGG